MAVGLTRDRHGIRWRCPLGSAAHGRRRPLGPPPHQHARGLLGDPGSSPADTTEVRNLLEYSLVWHSMTQPESQPRNIFIMMIMFHPPSWRTSTTRELHRATAHHAMSHIAEWTFHRASIRPLPLHHASTPHHPVEGIDAIPDSRVDRQIRNRSISFSVTVRYSSILFASNLFLY